MGSSRRLALLASRAWTAARPRSELASVAVAARARGFAAVPATNDDDYKRLKAAKSSITVRTRRVRTVAWQACCGARRAPTPHVRCAASPLTRCALLSRRSGRRCATSRWRPWTPRWRAIAARRRARTCVAPDAPVAPTRLISSSARRTGSGRSAARGCAAADAARRGGRAWRRLRGQPARRNRHAPRCAGPGAHSVRELRVCLRARGCRLRHGTPAAASRRRLAGTAACRGKLGSAG